MKITICGSMFFAREMLKIKSDLEDMGHTAIVPIDTEDCIENPDLNADFEHVNSNDLMMDHFKKIEESDAILVVNNEKKGTSGYIGGSTLIEIGIAYYLGKKIFIMNELPSENELSYIFEVRLTQPTIINGNLGLIE